MTDLDKEPPPTIVARIAARADEITRARARGVTWRRIVEVIGSEVGVPPSSPAAAQRVQNAYVAAVKAIECGRLKPLPPATKPRPTAPGGFKRLGENRGGGEDLPPFGSNFEQL